jgi:hypothetical protein
MELETDRMYQSQNPKIINKTYKFTFIERKFEVDMAVRNGGKTIFFPSYFLYAESFFSSGK